MMMMMMMTTTTTIMMVMIMMMMIIIMVITIMIIIIVAPTTIMLMMMMMTLNGTIQDFCNLLTAPPTVSSTYSQEARVQSIANHALITCNMSCATWYEWTDQQLSLSELKSHLF